jgi:hypothetical protein
MWCTWGDKIYFSDGRIETMHDGPPILADTARRRVLVCGGRDYDRRCAVYRVLDSIHGEEPIRTIIQGGADGADTWAREWAVERNIGEVVTELADWSGHGKAAGPLRNKRMLEVWKPDLVVAFPGGRGTASMVNLAEKAGVKVMRILPAPPETLAK